MPLLAALPTVALALTVLWGPDSPAQVLVQDSPGRASLVSERRGRLGESAGRERSTQAAVCDTSGRRRLRCMRRCSAGRTHRLPGRIRIALAQKRGRRLRCLLR